MKANEARKKALEVINSDIDCIKELERVYNLIKERAAVGSFSLHVLVNYRYHEYILMKLNEDGYKVTIIFEKFEIRW